MKKINIDLPKDWLPLFEWPGKHFYQKQIDYLEAIKDHWQVMFLGGNGSGKSLTLWWSAVALALGVHPYQFAEPPLKIKALITDFEHGYGKIFTETALRTLYLPDNTEVGPFLPHSMIDRFPSRDDRTLMLKNGSFIFFQTSEQKKRLHSGTNFDLLLCDEEPDFQAFDESKRGLRTAKGEGRILMALTPPFDDADRQKGPSWTKFKIVDPWEKGEDPDTKVIKAAMSDNPAITKSFIRKFCKGKTEEQIRIQLYGEYPTWGEMVFPDFDDFMWDPATGHGHLLPNDFEVPLDDPEILFEMALDWHNSKAPAVVWTFEYTTGPNKGDVVIWDEISPNEGKGFTITDCKVAIHEHEGWKSINGRLKVRRYGDPKMKDKNNALISGFNPWDEFRAKPHSVRLMEAWNRDPGAGYSVVNDYLRGRSRGHEDHPRLFVKETCKTVRHNMKNHYWVKKGDQDPVPDTKFNDYCVGVKYILQAKSRKLRKRGQGRYSKQWPLTAWEGARGTYIPRGNYVG